VSDVEPAKRKLLNFLPSFAGKVDGPPPSTYAKSLREGLFAGVMLFALLLAWMFLRANDTARTLQPLIPAKSTAIEEPKVSQQAPNAPEQKLENPKHINALPPAPVEGLTENRNGKILPLTRLQDDMSPFQAYKKPFTAVPGKALVSIVVVDFGLSEKLSTSMLDNLSPEISLVMSPYTAGAAKWASAARAYGHEFWISLPMQTKAFGTDDTGPTSILSNASLEQNQERLFNVLGSAVGYVGLVTEKDHVLKSDDVGAEPILKQILGRGLALAESNPEIPAYGLSKAMEAGHPYVQNNFWIDTDLRPDAIDRALKDVELQATRKGKAIAFLHPYPVTIKKVQEWIKDAEGKGIQIAPLSAMAQ
jgi:polysaccharide deacetylase 2 family uncharacterized protein YibQ